jgi:5-methyltetrahydrofolate--homocysteine methyltransferase
MSRFLEALHSGRVLLMDGAMGTELMRAGLTLGEKADLWNLSRPGRVLDIHKSYVAAGAQCLLTNTFQVIDFDLVAIDYDGHDAVKIIDEAIFLARSAIGENGFVISATSPLNLEMFNYDALIHSPSLIRAIKALAQADAILLETASHPRVRDALRLIRDVLAGETDRSVPILLSLAYHRNANGDQCTINGDPPEAFAWPELAALGINCGKDIGMDDVISIVRRYRQATDLPLFARPNAGTPKRDGDQWLYPHTPQAMANQLPELLEAGVAMIGGCCGTTPQHIAAFKGVVDKWNEARP